MTGTRRAGASALMRWVAKPPGVAHQRDDHVLGGAVGSQDTGASGALDEVREAIERAKSELADRWGAGRVDG